MNDTPALSATLESVLIRKPLPKHVLDLRVKSKMMTKNRFSDGFTGWSSLVGSSINNCMAIVVQKRATCLPTPLGGRTMALSPCVWSTGSSDHLDEAPTPGDQKGSGAN